MMILMYCIILKLSESYHCRIIELEGTSETYKIPMIWKMTKWRPREVK